MGWFWTQTVYALDATTIDLCLLLFPWAQFRRHKSAVKLHTLLDLRGSIPTVVIVTGGQIHQVNILDQLIWEAGAIYLMFHGVGACKQPVRSGAHALRSHRLRSLLSVRKFCRIRI